MKIKVHYFDVTQNKIVTKDCYSLNYLHNEYVLKFIPVDDINEISAYKEVVISDVHVEIKQNQSVMMINVKGYLFNPGIGGYINTSTVFEITQ